MSDNPLPHLGSQFTDHVGRQYTEMSMPEDTAYTHPLTSFGEPRRLQVVDPAETRRFDILDGGIRPSESGVQGLIGYTDFYREPTANTNIGFMNVHPEHTKRGIASEMVNHLDRTTAPASTINMGKAMHEATVNIVKNINEKTPGRATMKVMFNPSKLAGAKKPKSSN